MHLSPWVMYLILQLDSISGFTLALALLAIVAAVILLIMGGVDAHANPEEWTSREYRSNAERSLARAPVLLSAGKKLACTAVFFALVTALLPSTKAMAAIVVLPAIVNNQNVQKEAGELYQLAKQGLAKAVDNIGKEEPKPEEEKQSE